MKRAGHPLHLLVAMIALLAVAGVEAADSTDEQVPAVKEAAAAKRPAFDVTGTWRGVTVNAGENDEGKFENRYLSVWSLRQTGAQVNGTVKFTRLGGGAFAEFRLRGEIDGESVTLQTVSRRSTGQGWCFPAAALHYGSAKGVEYLAGQFLYNSVANGCSVYVPGRIKLSRGA